MSIISHDGSLARETNVLPFMLQCLKNMPEVSGVVDSSGVYDDPVLPIDVPLGFNPANVQVNVNSGRCGAAQTPD